MIFYKNISTYIKRFKNEIILRPVVICKHNDNKNGVCLTFDDGPNKDYTLRILDILDKFSGKATFFLIGENIIKYNNIFEEIVNRGHQVCNHTMTHKTLWRASWLEIKTEIESCDNLLKCSTDYNPKYIRPPKGTIGIKLILYALFSHKKLVLWSLDTKDYLSSDKDGIITIFESHLLYPGDIILFHDKMLSTVDALERVLQYINDSGLKTLTLNELLEN